jgi:dipeptidyl aminopeptidase/acylaminoacyl peptidase
VGNLKNGSLHHTRRVAGSVDESIFQPEWSPDGKLYFISDRNGWWNLHCWHNGKTNPVCEMEAEFGVPQWVFGKSTYGFESAARIICTYTQEGIWHLASLDTATGDLHEIKTGYTFIEYLRAAPGRAVFCAGSPTIPTSIVQVDLATCKGKILRRSSSLVVDHGYLSLPQPVEFPTEQGTAHAIFYPPENCDYKAPPDETPPLVVFSHGGPTDAASSVLSLKIQYWTSRGIGVLDVNYGGSTGYGRPYREKLKKQWGIVDVDDCVNGAQYLVTNNMVDGNRLAIRGGSAGGYTTLCALTFHNIFKAGASYYGVSDLESLAKETHKFESHYLDSLIGPYPEDRATYRERSPINYVEALSCPVIFFQGLEDKVVLPNQAEKMVDALRAKGVPVAYIPFEGEQHGFRRAKTMKRALDAELYFYSKIFSFELADPVDPVVIENL